MAPTPEEQLDRLTWNAVEVVPRDDLLRKLGLGRPLRVKLGLDPTAEHVTLGWAVVLRKLRDFQELGHQAVLIVGDFTARVGDPSEQAKTRPMLTKEQVDNYAANVLDQFFLVLDRDRTEVRRNSEWLEPLGADGLLRLASQQTLAHTMQRDDFANRWKEQASISLMELMYPLLQGYDSVAVQSDVEIGGTDQHFNLLVGRDLQRSYGQDPQVIVTMPLIEGTDGIRKMSQSLGNYIAITESADEIFGKAMSIPDELMPKYLRVTTGFSRDEAEPMVEDLAIKATHPAKAKRLLAHRLVELYHGMDEADAAARRFDQIFAQRELPKDAPQFAIPESAISGSIVYLPRLLAEIGFAESSTSARRLISQGGVYLDGHRIDSEELDVAQLRGKTLAVGKRRFARLT